MAKVQILDHELSQKLRGSLNESEESVESVKSKIESSLGSNSGVVVTLKEDTILVRKVLVD